MMPVTHARLEALLQPVGSEIEAEGMVELSSSARAVINLLRDDPGRASVKSLPQCSLKIVRSYAGFSTATSHRAEFFLRQ
jgi:hypothetical protein